MVNSEQIENQIIEKKKEVDFDTREFTVEFLVEKYLNNLEKENNEIFVPEYQRDFVWDEDRQSKLVESIILGLPIPIIFLAECSNGRLEIVDGSQRIRTLAGFINDELVLEGLETLTFLNKCNFSSLPESRKRKIKNTAMRMIVLSEMTTEETKTDLFERINRGSDLLRNMEKRKGIYKGSFTSFLYELHKNNPTFNQLAPLAKSVRNRQEHEELILRFFCLVDQYPKFRTHRSGIGGVLDNYLESMNNNFNDEEKNKKTQQFQEVLNFVQKFFPLGFSKRKNQGVSRIFFEAVSVGVHLALEQKPNLSPKRVNVDDWLANAEFHSLVSGSTRTHTPPRIIQRVNFVRDHLLAAK